jgi:hypothetical protein
MPVPCWLRHVQDHADVRWAETSDLRKCLFDLVYGEPSQFAYLA